MVKIKSQHYLQTDSAINIEAWLIAAVSKHTTQNINLIRQACFLAQLAGTERATLTCVSCLQQGLSIAEILIDLNLDPETIAAAIVYGSVQYAGLTLDDISENLNPHVAKLVHGVKQMDAMSILRHEINQNPAQAENLRKMLLAMVDDVRVVLIKLAERTYLLRCASILTEKTRQQLARETMDIYAPLANRLGIWQIKWELEDLSFRYLEPMAYKKIAKWLDQKRLDREEYVEQLTKTFTELVETCGITQFEISGRAKHIYSIYRKMQRKKVEADKIYDISAVRILVPTITDCYAVLGAVHTQWQQISEEFDDYITTPKPNGYRSIHTAIVGPEKKNIEVQIRTFSIHKEAELGVAAHWRYKEGVSRKATYENKIAWLREVMAWEKELLVSNKSRHQEKQDIFNDQIYVFTPQNDIVELPQQATPLDFAYYIHSEIGHRCRGAKVNGNIVPLTSSLQTGDRIEVLTGREQNPSRDWLNPHLGYLKTARARAKASHWFRVQDFDKNLADGKAIVERELKKLASQSIDYEKVAERLHYKSSDEMFAALGSGDFRIGQLLNHLEFHAKPERIMTTTRPTSTKPPGGIHIQGVGQLLTHIAKCCQPLPGDPIIGFITQGYGVSIHRKDCANILQNSMMDKKKFIEADWGSEPNPVYLINIHIAAYHRQGLLRDITTVLSNEKINLIHFQTQVDKEQNIAHTTLTIEISHLNALSKVLDKIHQLPNVFEVKRQA